MNKASGYSLCTNCYKSKLDCYRGNDFMDRFCQDLKEHTTKITNYEKKKRKKERNSTTNSRRK